MNFEHNGVVHERVVLLTVQFDDIPYVAKKDRLMVEHLELNFFRITAKFGYMQTPDVPRALELCAPMGLDIDLDEATFFLGRETLIPSKRPDLKGWREKLFIYLFRNASSPIQFFRLPPRRVFEIGTIIDV
jgi:KUP system potassium uptake protein